MLNPLAKQSDAIHMATKDLYSSIFGKTHVEPIHGTGFYGLIADEVKKSLCRELGVAELTQLPVTEHYKSLEVFKFRYHQLIDRESNYGKYYLYHKAFFKAFLEKAEYEKDFGIPLRYYLEENYAPDSDFKPRQLDTWEDYQYLSEKMRDALNDSLTEYTPYQRHYLANALTWFNERAVELQSLRFDSAAIPIARDELAAPSTPAPPVRRTPITVDDLCLNSFTPADLTELLVSLNAIPKDLPHRWTERPANRKGVQSRIVAALTTLSQPHNKLFSNESDLWEEAILVAYGVSLGHTVTKYDYDYKSANATGSSIFGDVIEKTHRYITRWKSAKKIKY